MAEFVHTILEFLENNHFTDAGAALRSELMTRLSSNGSDSFSLSDDLKQESGARDNEICNGGRGPEWRDAGYMHIKDDRPYHLNRGTSFENGVDGLKDEAEKSRSFLFSGKAMLNKSRDSELLVKELGCYSSKYEPSGERRDQKTEQAVSEAEQMSALEDDYADEAWICSKTPFEPKQLQDSAGAAEERFMFQKDNMLSKKKFDQSSSEEQVLVLNAVSNEVFESEERLRNKSGQAKDKFYETQKGEIVDEGFPELRDPARRHSTEEWKARIDPVSPADGDSHASMKWDGSLKLHGGQISLSGHDKKTCSQVAGAMFDRELNIKERANSNQESKHFVREVSADEGAQNIPYFQEYFGENRGFKSTVQSHIPFVPWKEGSFRTVMPFTLCENSVNDDQLFENQAFEKVVNKRQQGIEQKGMKGSKITEEIDKEGASMQIFDHQESPEQEKVERPTSLQIGENILNVSQERFDVGRIMNSIGSQTKRMDMETSFSLGPYFNAPARKEIRPSGGKLTIGSHQVSPSQTIDGNASELVFAGGLRRFVDCPIEQWDFDEYENEDDLGYIRKTVEDEAYTLAHEIDYLNNNVQRRYEHGMTRNQEDNHVKKDQEENQSLVKNLYFLGGQSNDIEPKVVSQNLFGLCTANLYGKRDYSGLADRHDGQTVGDEETNLMPVSNERQSFAMQSNGVEMLCSEEITSNDQQPRENVFWVDDNQHQFVRSTCLENCDIEDAGTDLKGSFVVLGSEAVGIDGCKPVKYDQSSSSHSSLDRVEEVQERQEPKNDKMVRNESDSWRDHTTINEHQAGKSDSEQVFIKDVLKERHNELYSQNPYSRSLDFEGFSFPYPSDTGDVEEFKIEPGKSLWSTNVSSTVFEGANDYRRTMIGHDVQIPLRQKSDESSPFASQRDGDLLNMACTMHLTTSTQESTERIINEGYSFNDIDDGDVGVIEDEEATALREQVQQIKAQEDEFETFDLQIVHRRNRTGFEENKNYHVALNSVIAGHYHVIERLGSAAFSNAVQARDLHTGMDVCLKIIKNNKEFFDQSLDEIKLLRFVNRHDPADKYHILRLYNYFYYHEHLFIVCELLKANLYEFNKFNRESGGEVYFTMPRIQSIAIQCLEALQFLHNLGLIHCDLKPENILVKSYSRCEVKVIDLGSSCFETDHLCPYVQSRSYRAPEVILGLPYDKRIDIWSLGCILAELCSGNVLFQNESSATLLARIIGTVGPIEAEMLDMGHDTHKYFTKDYVLYEQNKDTNRVEFLMPKKTSLRHRLSMGDEGFIDFVSYLLEINPKKRPTASEALQHPWLSYPYEPISS